MADLVGRYRQLPTGHVEQLKSGARRATISEAKGKLFAPVPRTMVVEGQDVFPIVVSASQQVRSRTRNPFYQASLWLV